MAGECVDDRRVVRAHRAAVALPQRMEGALLQLTRCMVEGGQAQIELDAVGFGAKPMDARLLLLLLGIQAGDHLGVDPRVAVEPLLAAHLDDQLLPGRIPAPPDHPELQLAVKIELLKPVPHRRGGAVVGRSGATAGHALERAALSEARARRTLIVLEGAQTRIDALRFGRTLGDLNARLRIGLRGGCRDQRLLHRDGA